MALSVSIQPRNPTIDDSVSYTGTYSNGSSTAINIAHGLLGSDYIYIPSGQAAGYWYITLLSANTFQINAAHNNNGAYTFVGAGTFTYYKAVATPAQSTSTMYQFSEATLQGWSAVNLPVVFRGTSNLWPVNSVDTARTVSSYSNDFGYCKLTLSGNLTSTVTELEFVKITFTGGTTGIYQILTWYSNSVVTVNLAYAGGITFTSVQYYYNNYHVRVRIYAGLDSVHKFAAQKPMTQICEIKVVPNSSNEFIVNVNEYLKSYIDTLINNPSINTAPNNIGAFCQFYISTAEGYDYSIGGYTLLDYVSSYSDYDGNTAIPRTALTPLYAVNASMPFKNRYAGFMNDYLYINSAYTASREHKLKFLTPSVYPVLNSGFYFDISFINQYGFGVSVRREVFLRGVLQFTYIDDVPDNGIGIYRYSLSRSVYLEDEIRITVRHQDYGTNDVISETKVITVNSDCYINSVNICWLNYLGGFDYWTFKSNSDYGVDIEGTTQSSENIISNWPNSFGESASTIRKETSRTSGQSITVRAERITQDQVNDLYRILTSPLVQIVNSSSDLRTIIPDASSFTYLKQSDKLFDFEFSAKYTDNLPSQSL
jgi:hypothetical protein